ncbi:MAG: hypothetical protein Kow0010_11380 [Dehalococcoidia bacterium]
MRTTVSHAEFDAAIELQAMGTPLPVTLKDVGFYYTNGLLDHVRATFVMDPDTYRRIDADALFHLEPEHRGPGADRFEPTGDVQVEARLDTDLLLHLLEAGGTPEEAGHALIRLAAEDPANLLVDTDSWYALGVTVAVDQDAVPGGTLREGYSTTWASHDSSGSAALEERLLALDMITVVLEWLREHNFTWEETGDDEVVHTTVAGDNGSWSCYILCREAAGRCIVYARPDWETPEPHRAAMAELLTRINFGLPLGNFEMDLSDGEVRFKTSVDVSGDRLSTALFEALFETNAAAMDIYLPALEAVRDGRMSPADAVAMVED